MRSLQVELRIQGKSHLMILFFPISHSIVSLEVYLMEKLRFWGRSLTFAQFFRLMYIVCNVGKKETFSPGLTLTEKVAVGEWPVPSGWNIMLCESQGRSNISNCFLFTADRRSRSATSVNVGVIPLRCVNSSV